MVTSKDIFDEYDKCDYIKSSDDADSKKLRYKYQSPINFIEFINEIETKNIRWAYQDSSHSIESEFYGSKDFPEAMTKFREATFDFNKSKKSNSLIIKMRQGIRYTDSGDELSVPEYLGKSENYFIEHELRNRRKRLILQKPIIINLGVNCFVNALDIERTSLRIVNKLYEHQIRVPKIIISYLTDNADCSGNKNMIFIDVPYFDFNSLMRFSLSSTFRRLIFRHLELIGDLSSSYGNTLNFPMANSLNDVIQLEKFCQMDDKEIDETMDRIIAETIKQNNINRNK